MITNKDIRIENGNIILNGDKYPLDGQSPEAIMAIVKDNSDTTPTENSTAPITSGGVFAADKDISDTIGDITQTGVTGASVADQLAEIAGNIEPREITLTSPIGTVEGKAYVTGGILLVNAYVTLTSAIVDNNGQILTLGESVIKGSPNWLGANVTDAGIIRGYGTGDKIYCQTNTASGKLLGVALAFPIN